jgi:hypothetical protein
MPSVASDLFTAGEVPDASAPEGEAQEIPKVEEITAEAEGATSELSKTLPGAEDKRKKKKGSVFSSMFGKKKADVAESEVPIAGEAKAPEAKVEGESVPEVTAPSVEETKVEAPSAEGKDTGLLAGVKAAIASVAAAPAAAMAMGYSDEKEEEEKAPAEVVPDAKAGATCACVLIRWN